jgi:preprotein translocase subunit YajC
MGIDAYAQAAGGGAPANSGTGMLLMLLQFVPLFVILYFLLIRPQQQRQKTLEKMLKNLKKGDRVLTSGGIFGTVVGVDDAKVVLRIAEELKVEFAKSAVVQVVAENS